MLVVRLRRAGSKSRPFFRVVVTEHSSPREGRFVEVIGHYNPRTQPEKLVLDRARLDHWVKSGAKMSDTVRTLVDRNPAAPEAGALEPSNAASASERSGESGAP